MKMTLINIICELKCIFIIYYIFFLIGSNNSRSIDQVSIKKSQK